ncbi:MAG: hypothetical protein BroJett040_25420 [Oligoflexia bacterium]|nr:MAG: hypothetical protein BroJett040_25420 [Oligoflexia bacterium]
MNKLLLTTLLTVVIAGAAQAQSYNPLDPNVSRGPDGKSTEGVFPDTAKAAGDDRCVDCEMKKAVQVGIKASTAYQPSQQQSTSGSVQKGTDQE